jgi:hypothetical protein
MDEDSKERRNLVVFCASILLVFWLEVPVAKLAAAALKVEATWTPSPLKIWTAAIGILAYLVLRYRFSEAGERLLEGIVAEQVRLMRKLTNDRVTLMLDQFHRSLWMEEFGGRAPAKPLAMMLARHEEERKANLPSVTFTSRPSFRVEKLDVHGAGRAVVDVLMFSSYEGPFGVHSYRSAATLEFALDRGSTTLIQSSAFFRSWLYSRGAIDYVLPLVMAIAAGAVATIKLAYLALDRIRL